VAWKERERGKRREREGEREREKIDSFRHGTGEYLIVFARWCTVPLRYMVSVANMNPPGMAS